jgi:hypothetical protein
MNVVDESDDDIDIMPVTLMSKPKLKSFSFAHNLASMFTLKTTNSTLKEINFNAKSLPLEEAEERCSEIKTATNILSTTAQVRQAENASTPNRTKSPQKVLIEANNKSCQSQINNTVVTNPSKKRPRDNDDDDEWWQWGRDRLG